MELRPYHRRWSRCGEHGVYHAVAVWLFSSAGRHHVMMDVGIPESAKSFQGLGGILGRCCHWLADAGAVHLRGVASHVEVFAGIASHFS